MNIIPDEFKKIAHETGYTPFMISQMHKVFQEDFQAVLHAFGKPAISTIRVNTLKTTPEEIKAKLEHKGFLVRPTPWIDYAYHINAIDSNLQIGATHEYLEGFYYLQSLGSMVPAHLLYPAPNDKVLDMCAAPGSKTTQMGQMMKQQGTIVAVDVKKTRLGSLNFNLRRCGIYNCITFPYDSRQLKSKLTTYHPNKILLDAPCSGSGIIRVDPSPKRMKDDSHLKRLAATQKELLRTGLDLLSPGGKLMYSTCSFHYQENEQVIAEVLSKRKDVEIIEPSQDIGLPGLEQVDNLDFGYEMLKTRRLYPNLHDSDAFFMCLLEKQ